MDNNQNALAKLHEVVTKGNSGAIVLSSNPTADATAAACALYLGLTKMSKSLTLACSGKPQFDLVGTDKIQNNLVGSGDNLVISFPYTEGSIDKVDYNIQGNSFNLIVAPRQGFPKLDPQQVKYNYTGGTVDFIITLDAPNLNSLGNIYSDNQNQFIGHDIINVDRHLTNAFFGTVNFVNKTASSISELVLSILQNLQIEMDRDMATNLYAGVSSATNNFTSYSVNADTFEHIAALLRMGAVKKVLRKPDMGFQSRPNREYQPSQNNPKPIENVEKEKQPQDWLKPKIFRAAASGDLG